MPLWVPSAHTAGLEQHSADTVIAVPKMERRKTEMARMAVGLF